MILIFFSSKNDSRHYCNDNCFCSLFNASNSEDLHNNVNTIINNLQTSLFNCLHLDLDSLECLVLSRHSISLQFVNMLSTSISSMDLNVTGRYYLLNRLRTFIRHENVDYIVVDDEDDVDDELPDNMMHLIVDESEINDDNASSYISDDDDDSNDLSDPNDYSDEDNM